MTRSMGDATHDGVPALAQAGTDMVAGYVTGAPGTGIQWTAADWALFAGRPEVTIDQGAAGSPVMTAHVRDVESGAWTMGAAVNRNGWTAPRPTLYFSESMLVRRFFTKKERIRRVAARLKGAYSAGWRGDVWVALYDGVPALNFPVPPGINVVAKQYTDLGGGGAYDLSVVFDPYWPDLPPDPPAQENCDMATLIRQASNGAVYLLDGGKVHYVGDPESFAAYTKAGLPIADGVSDSEVAGLLKDFPPGEPPVNVTFPTFTVTPS